MHTLVTPSNPFALMVDPQAVLEAVERSGRLNRLQSHVHRPLDKPLIPRVGDEAADFDDDINHEQD